MRGIQVDVARFRQLRQARGLTQLELAHLAGVSERTVRNAELGRRVRLDFLRYLATALEIDIADVVHTNDELRTALREQRRVDRILNAIQAHTNGGDLSEFFQLVSKDVFVNVPGPVQFPISGEYRGVDGFKTFLDRSITAFDYELPPEITETRASGNLVMFSGFDRLRVKSTGKSFSGNWMHIYEFEKGRIVRFDNWSQLSGAWRAFQTE
jgi:transcriptional regulator with XRE-family HTH domain